jgi:hypothetical protein
MAGTNVPPPSFTATGFLAPQPTAILAGVEADFSAAFNAALNFNLNTPQGQLASSEAAVIANAYAIFVYYTQQVDPAYASGRMQDAIGRIYGLSRNPAEPTTLQVNCTGGGGGVAVSLPVGATVQDESGNLYALTSGITLPAAGGTVVGSFACMAPGPIAVPSADAISIYQAISGWDSVSVASGTEGTNDESRQAFAQRMADSVAGNSLGPIGAIIGAVAAVSGVTDYFGYNNNTSGSVTVGGVAIAAYSIYICVAGGSPSDIAQAILSKKGAGAPMVGTTTITAYDDNPLYASPIAYDISFTVAVSLQLLFKVQIVNSAQVPANAATLIQNALIAAVTQGIVGTNTAATPGVRARIGQVIYATTYVQAINALGSWAQVASIGIGSANTPDAVIFGTISGTALTVHSVTSGTVATGEFLTDPNGLIANGTEIVSGSGSSWVVNQPQTVGGISFTANSTGTTTLTASAVTGGTIEPGDLIVGSGIPGGTTIVQQLTGTSGGAGTYETSASTTLTNVATTTYTAISGSTADQTLVSFQANQEPQLTASNIVVSLT